MSGLSVVTNACPTDAPRIRATLPSWLRVFGARLSELVVTLDESMAEGRIAALHCGAADLPAVRRELDALAAADRRVRVEVLPAGAERDRTLEVWFGRDRPVRCQAGTPIHAFVHAFESAREPLVLRADCDMLFHEAGWLAEAERKLASGEWDLVEPGRAGVDPRTPGLEVSTRALLLRRDLLGRVLPIHALRLDPLRRLHRRLRGRSPYLALEQMLDGERRAGRVRHSILPTSLGWSLHVATRQQAALEWFPEVVARVERGEIPERQLDAGPNFLPAAWEPLVSRAPRATSVPPPA